MSPRGGGTYHIWQNSDDSIECDRCGRIGQTNDREFAREIVVRHRCRPEDFKKKKPRPR